MSGVVESGIIASQTGANNNARPSRVKIPSSERWPEGPGWVLPRARQEGTHPAFGTPPERG